MDLYNYRRPLPRRGLDRCLPAEQSCTLRNAGKTETLSRVRVPRVARKAFSVVLDGQRQAFFGTQYSHGGLLGFRVLQDIVYAFLHDAVEVDFGRFRKYAVDFIDFDGK